MKDVIPVKKYYKYMVGGVFPDNHMSRCRMEKCKESVMIVITTHLWRSIKKTQKR